MEFMLTCTIPVADNNEGYTVKYGGGSRDFRFATVMGSGHEVPTFKPIPAYAMMTRFEAGQDL